MSPVDLWIWSCKAHGHKLTFVARVLKFLNWFIFHSILPYQAIVDFDDPVHLEHLGLGVVIHPNVKIGKRVKIFHQVTLATETWIGSPFHIVLEDDVVIGAGAKVIGRGNQTLVIGRGAIIGANAVVTKDVRPGDVVVGSPARTIKNINDIQPEVLA